MTQREKITAIILIISASVLASILYFRLDRAEEEFVDPFADEIIETDEEFSAFFGERSEAWDRNLSGVDKLQLYTLRGTVISIEVDTVKFRLRQESSTDVGDFVSFEERQGRVNQEQVVERTGQVINKTTIKRLSPDPNNPSSIISEEVTLEDLRVNDKIEVRSYANLMASDVDTVFDIEEIFILY